MMISRINFSKSNLWDMTKFLYLTIFFEPYINPVFGIRSYRVLVYNGYNIKRFLFENSN